MRAKLKRLQILALLNDKHMYQKELCKQSGVSQMTVSCAMNGKMCNDMTVVKIAKVLEVAPEEIATFYP